MPPIVVYATSFQLPVSFLRKYEPEEVIKSDSMIDVQGGMAGVVREGSNPLQFALTLLSSYQTHSLSLQDLQNLK